MWAAAAAVVLALAGLLAVVLWQSSKDKPPTEEEMNQVVVTCGAFTLTNTELNYYYWSEYFYLLGTGGDALSGTLDTSVPLDQQMYDETRTWQDYVLDRTLDTVEATMSMAFAAEEAGFEMPDDYAQTLQRVLDGFAEKAETAGYLDASGEGDTLAYLAASYGPGVTMDSFERYLRYSHLAAAYSDELYGSPVFTEEEISDYYDLYGGEYTDEGVTKDSEKLRTLRVVLVAPSADNDAAWAEAKTSAETLYATWQAESGTEDDFSAMAAAHSADVHTSGQGGLLSEVRREDLTGELADWAFDQARESGDTAVVRSDEGWVVAYFVEESDQAYWQQVAEADLRQQTYKDAERAIRDRYDFQENLDAVHIATPQGLYGEESLTNGD